MNDAEQQAEDDDMEERRLEYPEAAEREREDKPMGLFIQEYSVRDGEVTLTLTGGDLGRVLSLLANEFRWSGEAVMVVRPLTADERHRMQTYRGL